VSESAWNLSVGVKRNEVAAPLEEMLDQIFLEDGLEGMKRIPDKAVDMVLCDLPYGTTDCEWDQIIPTDQLWEQYERIVKDIGAIVLTATQPFASVLVHSNTELFKYDWIWEKVQAANFANAKIQPLKVHESVLVFSRASMRKMKYNPQGVRPCAIRASNSRGVPRYMSSNKRFRHHEYVQGLTNYPSTILRFGSGSESDRGLHPTQKPVALFEYLIRTYTDPGDVVVDNCMGSGTTAIACIRSGRHFIGFELEPDYHRLATKRVAKEMRLWNPDKARKPPEADVGEQMSLF